MDKAQGLHSFWSSFGLDAYDEYSVPESAPFPYITYSVKTDELGYPVSLNASLWYRTTSWGDISRKADEIAQYIKIMPTIKLEDGRIYITKGVPFAQRMDDPNDSMIKRMYINITAEFLTAY